MMKKILGFLWGLVEVIVVLYVILITSFILCRNKYGFTQIGNYTIASLNETRATALNSEMGNLLVVKYTLDIKEGDIIYYYYPDDEEYVIKKEPVKAVRQDGSKYLFSVGDNGKTVASNRVLGKYANQYQKLGSIKDLLESRLGFLLLVLLPIMIIFIYQIYQFVLILKYKDKTPEDKSKENAEDKSKDEDNKDDASHKEETKDEDTSDTKTQEDKFKIDKDISVEDEKSASEDETTNESEKIKDDSSSFNFNEEDKENSSNENSNEEKTTPTNKSSDSNDIETL